MNSGYISKEEVLNFIHNKINILRHKNKTKDDFDELYIFFKSFFNLVDLDFPRISDNPKNLIDDKYKNIYDKIVDELTILGYYLGLRSEIVKISDALILDKKCTINKNQVISNQRFYLEPLKIIKNIVLPLKLDQGWFAMNPSILKITDGYLINCRLVNYNITHEGLYIIYHPARTIISRNLLLKLDTNFNILESNEILDKSIGQKFPGRNIIGLEDAILFEYQDSIWFTCTTLDTNERHFPQISLCKLETDFTITTKVPLRSPQNRPEKNWLPLVHQNQLKFIYEYNPLTILTFEDLWVLSDPLKDQKEHFKVSETIEHSLDFSRFKGSCAPLEFLMEEPGYLLMIHETFNLNSALRCYLHRFLWMDVTFKIKKISHPWYFQKLGIEFCRSFCYSHNPGDLILTYSIHDKDAQIAIISIDYVRKLLNFKNL